MPELGRIVEKVRSKNAGPFWLTVDIFCGSQDAFVRVRDGLSTSGVARILDTPAQTLKRFDIEDLAVVKLSLPRPAVQGTTADRDMHGAALAALIAEIEIP
ncbi:DUF4387 family protein [Boseongicola aestuarii]|jgi:hypothetical protein|uniref:DUF4387 domain-containing protein n=1 Tax=Boseongicola aestuarii TaxID=1470561 RepID=A0A238IYC3_9RHOB|nr:DUF4387 family protein [Boseongicola aestuarii]SMX23396.1 hypothetical protein BOA8489_01503 [Boseongicola aestuarii]